MVCSTVFEGTKKRNTNIENRSIDKGEPSGSVWAHTQHTDARHPPNGIKRAKKTKPKATHRLSSRRIQAGGLLRRIPCGTGAGEPADWSAPTLILGRLRDKPDDACFRHGRQNVQEGSNDEQINAHGF